MAIATQHLAFAHGPLARAQRYHSALIATDFTRTAEAFHRWLLHLGRQAAGHVCLVHLEAQSGDDDSNAILLEGLRCRMRLSPEQCEVLSTCPLDNLPLEATQLVILGRSQCMQSDPSNGQALIDRARSLGCDVIVIDDIVPG